MPIYLNYDSLAIKGDVTAEGHTDWIELSSFQFGIGRGISSPTGGSGDRESSAASVSEITATKAQDISSPLLMSEALQGEGKVVIIEFVRTDKGQLETYLTYTLTDTMISGMSTSSGGDRPAESFSLNFTKFEMKTTPGTSTNAGGSPQTVTYDVAKGKVV